MNNRNINQIPAQTMRDIKSILTNFGVIDNPLKWIPRKQLITLALRYLFPKRSKRDRWAHEHLTKAHSVAFNAESIADMLLWRQNLGTKRRLQRELDRRGTYTVVNGVPL